MGSICHGAGNSLGSIPASQFWPPSNSHSPHVLLFPVPQMRDREMFHFLLKRIFYLKQKSGRGQSAELLRFWQAEEGQSIPNAGAVANDALCLADKGLGHRWVLTPAEGYSAVVGIVQGHGQKGA